MIENSPWEQSKGLCAQFLAEDPSLGLRAAAKMAEVVTGVAAGDLEDLYKPDHEARTLRDYQAGWPVSLNYYLQSCFTGSEVPKVSAEAPAHGFTGVINRIFQNGEIELYDPATNTGKVFGPNQVFFL